MYKAVSRAVVPLGACPDCSFSLSAVDDVATTHHVVYRGFVLVVRMLVLACGAGVVGIGAKSMSPAVVEPECVAMLLNGLTAGVVVGGTCRFVGACGIVGIAGLGTGKVAKAFFVGFCHVRNEVGPGFVSGGFGLPFLEGVREDSTLFQVVGD